MARDERKRQQSLQRKAAKRKEKRRSLAAIRAPGGRNLLRAAARWPLLECLISENWREAGQLVQIVVARQAAGGEVGVASLLVDLGCLGVKDAFARVAQSRREYDEALREAMLSKEPMIEADLNLAAKIVRDANAYAAELGFKPHRDYHEAAPFLADADPDASDISIPVGGPSGKPLFTAGPYDDVDRILSQLTTAVGAGNFDFTVGFAGNPSLASAIDEEIGP